MAIGSKFGRSMKLQKTLRISSALSIAIAVHAKSNTRVAVKKLIEWLSWYNVPIHTTHYTVHSMLL